MSLQSSAEPASDTNTTVKGDFIASNDGSAAASLNSEEAPAIKKRKIMANDGIAEHETKAEFPDMQHSREGTPNILLDLPAEILAIIYELAFQDNYDKILSMRYHARYLHRPPYTGALAFSHTNRALRVSSIQIIQSMLRIRLRDKPPKGVFLQISEGFLFGTVEPGRYMKALADYEDRTSLLDLLCERLRCLGVEPLMVKESEVL